MPENQIENWTHTMQTKESHALTGMQTCEGVFEAADAHILVHAVLVGELWSVRHRHPIFTKMHAVVAPV